MNDYPNIKSAIESGMRFNLKGVDGRYDAFVCDSYKLRIDSGNTIDEALKNLDNKLKNDANNGIH